ncbi:MAG: hypothetical protein ACXQTK_02865 [Candidatus Syntropharchaeales archaeon]
MIYELYFKEKFAEVVSNHLKPVDYDRWSKLYWKAQLEGNLKPEEEKESKDLENKNLKTIIEVVKAIKSDREIIKLIERIIVSAKLLLSISFSLMGGERIQARNFKEVRLLVKEWEGLQ